jgi:putative FmdB family regulatory protein
VREVALPLYEYRCKKCGKLFEKIRKFSDPPLKTHEECGGAVERLLSSPAIQFKGSGFYITDYPKKSASSDASSAGSSESGSKGSAEAAKSSSPEASPAKSAEPSKRAKKKE